MKIFLIGMMGAGKSYWSQILGPKLQCNVFDLDQEIVSAAGMSIREIFENKGESYFRQLESDTLKLFAEKENFILATGGGTPCFNENMEWMNAMGITIWIDESAKVLAERLKPEKAHRPLLSSLSDAALHQYLSQKITERTPFYQKCQYRIGPYLEEHHFNFLLS